LSELGGILVTISFFFRLRVFDEIKDFASDAVLYPQRVLQSGRVNLGQLQVLAWVGAALELAWSVHRGWPATLGWGALFSYSLLMRYEFGVAEWLRARLLLYAISHMVIMPLVISWLWLAYAPLALFWQEGGLLLALLSLLGGFAFELARKIRTSAAIAAVVLVVLSSAGVQARLFWQLSAGWGAFLLLGGLLILTVAVYGTALVRPREKLVRLAELLVSLAMLVSYVAVIVSLRW
jgi:4-hydroxybenzoate polyprenyltransferase